VDTPLALTISELAAGLRRRRFSSIELTREALARLARIGPRYNAVAGVLEARALREAKEADGRLRRGGPGGLLLGIPYGAKDLLAARGGRTTWGAPPFRRQVLDFDAAAVERLREAGAVLAAKLAMIELAGGGGYRYPSASLQGPCRNPWNPDHWTGGSSSGTGAAVAAALVPYGLGSETSGSILSPSSCCGVTGLRPTYGLVSRFGAMALSWTMDKIGPMCRSAEDCGIVLEAIAGPDPRDPGSAGRGFRMPGRARPSWPSVRVGYIAEDFEVGPHPSAASALGEAARAIRGLGVRWRRIALPALPIDAAARTIIRAEGSAAFRDLIANGAVWSLADRRQAAGLCAGADVTAVEYLDALRIRRLLQDAFARLFADVDVILAPSRFAPAPRIDAPLDPEWRTRAARDRAGAGRRRGRAPAGTRGVALVPAGNLAGLPALSLPCGFSTTGLPLAVQVVGRPFEEGLLIEVGRAYQRETDWHRRLPPLAAATGAGAG
jgi:aspartyl-tRNA(Asn)/glutamyl-tRNA(Gln) amidotransferase subunit A